MPNLADLTTLRLGGPAAELIEVHTAAETIAAVSDADAAGRQVLLVGGGSNLVVADAGWPGVAILLRSEGIAVSGRDDVVLDVAAGEPWDALVARCVAEGWAGIECLSGIPGLTGATPVQNVGAYGQEVADTITRVTVWDRCTKEVRELAPLDCQFAYRDSIFKHSERYVVLHVQFRLRRDSTTGPAKYAELARRLGPDATLADARQTVLELRRSKGMVLDEPDHDTWSAGSFFTNPVVDEKEFEKHIPAGTTYPRYPADNGIKLSAAWLIDQAGFNRGYGAGRVSLSTKHTLALTNRGGATTAELIELARAIQAGVHERFGVLLRPEPRLVGVSL